MRMVRSTVSSRSIVMISLLLCLSFGSIFEGGQALVPERPEEREHLGEPLLPRAVQAPGAVPPLGDQAGFLEHGQMLGDGRAGDGELFGDGAGRELLAPDEAHDLAPTGLGKGTKLGVHASMLADSYVRGSLITWAWRAC